MKNLSLVLNIVLLLAVIFLFVDRFAGKKPPKTPPMSTDTMGVAQSLSVVHINLDSLHANSNTFQAKKNELEKRQADAEARVQGKLQAFQKEVIAYQQKAQGGTMTRKEMEDEEKRLGNKEQALAKERDNLANGLLDETDKFNEQFTNQIRGYLDSLKQEVGYNYILVTGQGSPVIVADPELDITNTVLDFLNKKTY